MFNAEIRMKNQELAELYELKGRFAAAQDYVKIHDFVTVESLCAIIGITMRKEEQEGLLGDE